MSDLRSDLRVSTRTLRSRHNEKINGRGSRQGRGRHRRALTTGKHGPAKKAAPTKTKMPGSRPGRAGGMNSARTPGFQRQRTGLKTGHYSAPHPAQPRAEIVLSAGSSFKKRDQREGMSTTVQLPGPAAFTAFAISSIMGRAKLHLFLLRITIASLRFSRFC